MGPGLKYVRSDRATATDPFGRQSHQSAISLPPLLRCQKELHGAGSRFLLNIDFVSHVALVAVMEEDEGPAICGGGRYVVVQPGKAELAFVVVDQYQGQGIGAALMRHLIVVARAAGIKEFIAEVLPENAAMLKLFGKSGLRLTTMRGAGVVHVTLQLA